MVERITMPTIEKAPGEEKRSLINQIIELYQDVANSQWSLFLRAKETLKVKDKEQDLGEEARRIGRQREKLQQMVENLIREHPEAIKDLAEEIQHRIKDNKLIIEELKKEKRVPTEDQAEDQSGFAQIKIMDLENILGILKRPRVEEE